MSDTHWFSWVQGAGRRCVPLGLSVERLLNPAYTLSCIELLLILRPSAVWL